MSYMTSMTSYFPYIFAADSTGLCSLLLTQLSLKYEPSEFKTAGISIGKPSLT